jgi:hypothetical protein
MKVNCTVLIFSLQLGFPGFNQRFNRYHIDFNDKFIYQLWSSAFFLIVDGYRGRHRKGIAIYNAAEVNLQQKLLF